MLALVLGLLTAGTAGAHPLGNFTVNQYANVEVAPAGVTVRFVLDQAEIPTVQLLQRHGEDRIAAEKALVADVLAAVTVRVDGAPTGLDVTRSALTFPAGQGGLATSRLELDLRATGVRLDAGAATISYASTYAADRVGWKEVVVSGASGVAVTATTAAIVDRTDGLRSYPQDLLASPPAMLQATIDTRPGEGGLRVGSVSTAGNVDSAVAGRDRDGLASLIAPDRPLTLGLAVLALLLAAGWGALHALAPGHGKTMVAAYLAGSRGTARHAFALGATVTVTHTSTVFALGLVTIALSEVFAPEAVFPWLALASGLLVLVLGLTAVRDRLRVWRQATRRAMAAGGQAHDHDDDHGDGHDHGHGHGHDDGPPDEGLTWRSLVALGVSGGLIPCPSALVLLLSAVALDRAAFGVVLVAAFSLGLAGVISAIGLAVLYARRLFARVPSSGRALRALPAASAVVITVLGVMLTARALHGLA